MNSGELARLARTERQVAFLFQHFGLDPAAADGTSAAPASGFGLTPADTFGISPAETFSAPVTAGYAAQPAPGYAAQPAPGFPAPPAAVDPGASPAVLAAIASGKLIVAIKLYRELTGMGLKEAKLAVEAIQRNGPR
jgi:ribosomal protein L7/L12